MTAISNKTTNAPATLTPTPVSPKAQRLHSWREAETLARSVVGYDSAAPTYGKSDLEVLNRIREILSQVAAGATPGTIVVALTEFTEVSTLVENLLKRKTARALAAQTYKNSK